MEHLLNPRGIAVVGASPNLAGGGGRLFKYLATSGYAGEVYPINPRYPEILGLKSYASIAEVPDPVDLAVLCFAAASIPGLVRECAERGIDTAVVYSDGFGRAGAGGLFDELRAAAHETGVRVLGPNTNGLRVTSRDLIAEIGTGVMSTGYANGPVAVISQGGGLTYFGAGYLKLRGGGTRYLIDTGSEVDIDIADAMQMVLPDPEVRAIGLIIEGLSDGRKLAEVISEARAAKKRVFVFKSGRSEAGAEVAVSHTGKIAGDTAVFEQILTDAGATICQRPEDLTSSLLLASRGITADGGGIGVVTFSGGFGVLAVDLGANFDVALPELSLAPSAQTKEGLEGIHIGNPMDIGSNPEAVGVAVSHLAAQPDIQVIAAWVPHQLVAETLGLSLLEALVAAAGETDKLVVVCGMVNEHAHERLTEAGVLIFESPSDLFSGLGLITSARTTDDKADELDFAHGDPSAVQAGAVTGPQAQELLAAAGITFVPTRVVSSAEQAVTFAATVRGAIVLKLEIEGIAHKTELGLVSGKLTGAEDVSAAFDDLEAKQDKLGGGEIVAQLFATGVEIALGAFRDVAFGPVLVVGAGGTLVELAPDVSFATAPITASHAATMLSRLAVYPLLAGYRGAQPRDVEQLVEAMVALSKFVASNEEFDEVEINPLIVGNAGDGAYAVDALLVRGDGA